MQNKKQIAGLPMKVKVLQIPIPMRYLPMDSTMLTEEQPHLPYFL